MQWLSRTIAVVVVMVSPGLIGMFFDKKLGTQFLTPTGFVIGTVLATVALLVIAQKFTPTAGGAPIPHEDEDDKVDEDEK
jgi:undecaprenyl pyrophosphate phosphatase UppP